MSDDFSVVGFDDVPEADFYCPPLTTVSQAFSELGRRAVELTLEALNGTEPPAAELVRPELWCAPRPHLPAGAGPER